MPTLATTINPSSWKTLNLANAAQQQVFLTQLVQYLQDQFNAFSRQLNSASFLAGILNGSGLLTSGALATLLATDLGNWTTPGSVNCAGYTSVFVGGTMTVAKTINFTNVKQGTVIAIYISLQAARVLKCNFTDPSSASYASFVYWTNTTTGANKYNFSSTGFSTSASQDCFYIGMAGAAGGVATVPFLALYG